MLAASPAPERALGAPPAGKVGTYGWYVAGALCVANIFAYLDRYLMSLVSEPLRHSLHVSDAQLGMLQGTGFAILYCFCAIPLGWIADFSNRRNLILFGVTVWSIATAAAAFCGSFGSLFLSRLFVGIGEASLMPAAMSILAAYFDRGRLARAISIYGLGAIVGHGATFVIGGAMLGHFTAQGGLDVPGLGHFEPWQALFLAAGGAGSLVVALILFTVREPARIEPVHADWPGRLRGFAEGIGYIRRHAGAYGVQIGIATCAATIGFAAGLWSVSLFVRTYGMSVPEAGALVGAITITAGPLGNLCGGWVTDRLTQRGGVGAPIVVIGCVLVGLAVLAPAFCLAPTVLTAGIAFTLFQFVMMFPLPSIWGGTQMITPERFRGIAASVALLLSTLFAFGAGPPLVGLLTDRLFGDPAALRYGMLLTTEIFCAIGVLIALFGRRTFHRSIVG